MQDRRTSEPTGITHQVDPEIKDYYLTKTIEDKWAVAYWDGVKFWDDPNQDGKLNFGIKREWIKEWHSLPH